MKYFSKKKDMTPKNPEKSGFQAKLYQALAIIFAAIIGSLSTNYVNNQVKKDESITVIQPMKIQALEYDMKECKSQLIEFRPLFNSMNNDLTDLKIMVARIEQQLIALENQRNTSQAISGATNTGIELAFNKISRARPVRDGYFIIQPDICSLNLKP